MAGIYCLKREIFIFRKLHIVRCGNRTARTISVQNNKLSANRKALFLIQRDCFFVLLQHLQTTGFHSLSFGLLLCKRKEVCENLSASMLRNNARGHIKQYGFPPVNAPGMEKCPHHFFFLERGEGQFFVHSACFADSGKHGCI